MRRYYNMDEKCKKVLDLLSDIDNNIDVLISLLLLKDKDGKLSK